MDPVSPTVGSLRRIIESVNRARGLRHGDRGSVIVVVALLMVVILGATALAVDLGLGWFAQHREQVAADAAALAGARDLPGDPTQAIADAQSYFAQNLPGVSPQITTPYNGDPSQIRVTAQRRVAAPFGSIFGTSSMAVTANATAKGLSSPGPLTTGYWIVPMAVSGSCGGSGTAPCVGTYAPKTGSPFNYIAYHHLGSCTGSTYSFCLTNLSSTGAWKESVAYDALLASWITGGYPSPETVPFESGDYQTTDCKSPCPSTTANACGHNAVPGSCPLIQALQSLAGDILLVPVFDPNRTKSLGHFYLVGFAVFQLNSDRSMLFYNAVDAAHWWITGTYLASVDCQSPPSGSGTPPGYGSVCYGTSGGGSGGGDYGVGTAGRATLTQ